MKRNDKGVEAVAINGVVREMKPSLVVDNPEVLHRFDA
jgi:hypothetical protein